MLEIGKCYEHKSGKQIHVCGKAKTARYGECLIGEEGWNPNKSETINPDIRRIHRLNKNTGWGLIEIPESKYINDKNEVVVDRLIFSNMNEHDLHSGDWKEISFQYFIKCNFEYNWKEYDM